MRPMILQNAGSQSVAPGPVASASCKLQALEMQIAAPHLDLLNQTLETLDVSFKALRVMLIPKFNAPHSPICWLKTDFKPLCRDKFPSRG